MRKKILALSLTTIMALSALTGVLVTRNTNVEPMTNETAMLIDDEESGEVLAANYTQEDFERVAKEAFDIINNIRKENGLSSFTWGGDWISNIRAEEITTIFSHYSESGQRDAGENCARTNSLNAQHVVDLWMNSPGHKAAILSNYGISHSALAVVEKNGRYYWVNNFFGPNLYKELSQEHEEELKKQEVEKKNQPSSAAAEVKQEEQKPAAEVKQEVKQETKPEVKEEQKPVIIPEVKQEEVKREVKKEQTPVSKAAETTPAPAPSSAAAQETASRYDYGLGKGTNGTDIVPVRIHYDKETDQYSSTTVTPEEWEQIKSNRQQRAETQTPSVQNETQPVQSNSLRSSQNTTRSQPSISEGETNSEGHKVVSRTTETRSDGVEIVKEESIAPNGTVWNSWWLAD